MATELFDPTLRALRRDRAFRNGPERFLFDRAFDDVLDRLSFVRRRFQAVLLIGCPDPSWIKRLETVAENVRAIDQGPCFVAAAGAELSVGDDLMLEPSTFDLCIVIGMLDTANDPLDALRSIRTGLRPDSLLIGVIPGGETLPRLRSAMRAADMVEGAAVPHVHPRIEASSLTALLGTAGFSMPVVDVDRVEVTYPSLARLVGDLRGMGATNILSNRPRRGVSRTAWAAAQADFNRDESTGKTVETFELLNFAAWTAAAAGTEADKA